MSENDKQPKTDKAVEEDAAGDANGDQADAQTGEHAGDTAERSSDQDTQRNRASKESKAVDSESTSKQATSKEKREAAAMGGAASGVMENRLLKSLLFGAVTAALVFLFAMFLLPTVVSRIVGASEDQPGKEYIVNFLALAFSGYMACLALAVVFQIMQSSMFLRVILLFIAIALFMLLLPTVGVLQQKLAIYHLINMGIVLACASSMWFLLFGLAKRY